MTFTIVLFDSGVCRPFNKENKMIFKRNQMSNREKAKLSVNKFLPEKKIISKT